MITHADGSVRKAGQFIRIDWPDGSAIQGYVQVSDTGISTMLRYGPEGVDRGRVMIIGANDELTTLVQRGIVQILVDH